MNNKIGIFDSGIGGLTTLEEIKKLLPNEDYIYYADSKNNPYGEKSDAELLSIVKDIVEYLLNKNVKIIVIACNTATTRCIEALRHDYPNINFVGTEPAIKVACDKGFKNTLVLATPGTISSEKVHKLVKDNIHDDQKIHLLACDGLANAIETKNDEKIDSILYNLLNEYKDMNIDSIVLGCTHYPIIKDKIQSFFPNANLIDGNIGVAKRVKFILKENNLLCNSNTGNVEFIQTK